MTVNGGPSVVGGPQGYLYKIPKEQQQTEDAALTRPTESTGSTRITSIRKRLSFSAPTADTFSSTDAEENAMNNLNMQKHRLLEETIQEKTVRDYGRALVEHFQNHKTVLLVSLLVFLILFGAGTGLALAFRNSQRLQAKNDAMDLAVDTGRFFKDELNKATMPLYSLATVAAEMQEFYDMPSHMGDLPMKSPSHRNLTGSICQDPTINARFDQVAATIKRNARMKGVLVLLELVPNGVVCLLHPKNNTEDFPPGIHFDPSGSAGLDLLSPPFRWHGETTLKNGDSKVTIAGPMKLKSCKNCHPVVEQAFMARLPIRIPNYTMTVPAAEPGQEPTVYPYWGFAVTKLNWKALVEKSGMYEAFERRGHFFRLTRVDSMFNKTSGGYDTRVVVLGESPNYKSTITHYDDSLTFKTSDGYSAVHTPLNTTDSNWEMTVTYYSNCDWEWWVFLLIAFLSFGVACLVYVILLQKHQHTEMLGRALAQEAMVKTERGMTSYFAHELRNPLGAIDSALKAMPEEDLPEDALELLAGMKLCSSFMSGVMNNLLDVRQMEEGKVTLHRMPLHLETVVKELHRMFLPSVQADVKFEWKSTIVSKTDTEWVTGDIHRIQQIFTNIVSNALKYTKKGSVTLTIGWVDDTNDQNTTTINNNNHRRRRNNDPMKDGSKKSHEGEQTGTASFSETGHRRIVRFECTDTGPGIPKHVQAQLFQRFARRGGAPGTGLGLAISKHLVDMMGGTIRFESDPTVEPGATCIVELPLPPHCPEAVATGADSQSFHAGSSHGASSGSTKSTKKAGRTSSSSSSSRPTRGLPVVDSTPKVAEPIRDEISILITDDIKMNRMMLKKRLLKCVATNATVSEASTGEEAIEICKRDTFDVIIMDQYMEGAGGVLLGTDTIIALKRMKVAGLLIGCSGNDMDQEFLQAGVHYVWQKPLPSNEQIIEQLRTALARHVPRKQETSPGRPAPPPTASSKNNAAASSTIPTTTAPTSPSPLFSTTTPTAAPPLFPTSTRAPTTNPLFQTAVTSKTAAAAVAPAPAPSPLFQTASSPSSNSANNTTGSLFQLSSSRPTTTAATPGALFPTSTTNPPATATTTSPPTAGLFAISPIPPPASVAAAPTSRTTTTTKNDIESADDVWC